MTAKKFNSEKKLNQKNNHKKIGETKMKSQKIFSAVLSHDTIIPDIYLDSNEYTSITHPDRIVFVDITHPITKNIISKLQENKMLSDSERSIYDLLLSL